MSPGHERFAGVLREDLQPYEDWSTGRDRPRMAGGPEMEDRIILEIIHTLAWTTEVAGVSPSVTLQADVAWLCRRLAGLRFNPEADRQDRTVFPQPRQAHLAQFLRRHFPRGHPLWGYVALVS